MKIVLISDDGYRHKKITANIWFHILLPFLILVGGLIIAVKYLSPSQSSSLPKDYKSHQEISQESAQRSRARLININHKGSSVVRKSDIKESVSAVESNLEKQKLVLKNLLASLEIKEAEEYLSQLLVTTISKNARSTISQRKSPRKRTDYAFSAPLKKGYVSSPFGERRDPINGSLRHHGGLDIATKIGSHVYAIANGFVSFSGKRGAYGNLLEINHSEVLTSRYAHLERYFVEKGQLVRKGDLIGRVGATGRVTGPHLHLEIRENNKIIDPEFYLNDALKKL